MFSSPIPDTLFHTQLIVLRDTLPSVFDGQPNGIHDARIATRRIRELLPLLSSARHHWRLDDLDARFRRLGRSLGRVRDADVRVGLLESLERRIPHAAPALVLVRQQRERRRLQLMRKLIKRLERLDTVELVSALLRGGRVRTPWPLSPSDRKWRRVLRTTLASRAAAALSAIERASGVYFPNRIHAARIAIKKLRYAMEIAHDAEGHDSADSIRGLKKAQDILGDLHDRQELIDDFCVASSPESTSPSNDDVQVALVRQVVEAEARHLHSRYLQRRERLIGICRAPSYAPASSTLPLPSLLAVGTLALSSGVVIAQRLASSSHGADHGRHE